MYFEKAENDGKENLDEILKRTEEKYINNENSLNSNTLAFNSNDLASKDKELNYFSTNHNKEENNTDNNVAYQRANQEEKTNTYGSKNANSNQAENGFDIKNLEKTIANIKKIKLAMQGNPLALIELMNPNEKMKDAVKVMKLLPAVLRAMGNDSDDKDNFFRNNAKNDASILSNSNIGEQKITFDLRENKSKSANFTINQNYSSTNASKNYDAKRIKNSPNDYNATSPSGNFANLSDYNNNDNYKSNFATIDNTKTNDFIENYNFGNLSKLLSSFQNNETSTQNPLLSALNNQFFAKNNQNKQQNQPLTYENLAKFLDKQ